MAAPSDGSGQPASPDSYLSILPKELFGNVLRYSSERPNRIDWAYSLPPRFLCDLLKVVPGAVGATFSGVCDGGLDMSNLTQQDVAVLRLGMHSSMSAYAGDRFVDLSLLLKKVVHAEFPARKAVTPSKAMVVALHCDALRSLATHGYQYSEPMCHVFEARGKQLHNLEACFFPPPMARVIAQHCTELRELVMCCHMNALNAVLPALGPRLKKLEIRSTVVADDLNIIQTQCHALESIKLRSGPGHNSAHAQLLASYRDQLKEADLNAFDLENVLIVVQACPNVEVDVAVNDPRVLDALKSHARVVRLSFATANSLGIRAGLKHCPALRHLVLSGFDEAEDDILVRAFSLPVPRLSSLESLIVYDGELRTKELELFSSCTGNLRWLDLSINCNDVEAILGLKMLTSVNKDLTYVRVGIIDLVLKENHAGFDLDEIEADDDEPDYDDLYEADMVHHFDDELDATQNHEPNEDSEKVVCELLRVIAQCPSVREIVIDDDPENPKDWCEIEAVTDIVANSCRWRRVDVEILGVFYGPK